MSAKVLVTPRSMTQDPPASLDLLRTLGADVVFGPAGRQPTTSELVEMLDGVTAWIAGVEPINAEILAAAPALELIARNGAGVDNIDAAAAAQAGIRVVGAPGANANGVAELAVGLMLELLRGTHAAAAALAAGRWERSLGRELASATVGVVGLGAIGGRVARIARAFGAQVVGHDPWASPSIVAEFELVCLEEVLTRADIVSLHVPGAADGQPLLDAARLSLLPRGAILVNTARWGLVDPDALATALADGRVDGYAVDAFAQEPPAPHPLLIDPRVLATPHLGASTVESARRAADAAVAHVASFLREAHHEDS